MKKHHKVTTCNWLDMETLDYTQKSSHALHCKGYRVFDTLNMNAYTKSQ